MEMFFDMQMLMRLFTSQDDILSNLDEIIKAFINII